jgi:uncharacterized protein (DUF1330 family)
MSGYLIANIEVSNAEGYREYAERVGAVVAAYGGRYLARGGASEVREGDWVPHRMVILEFPTLDVAREFYESEAYAEMKAIRLAHSHGQVVLLDGMNA